MRFFTALLFLSFWFPLTAQEAEPETVPEMPAAAEPAAAEPAAAEPAEEPAPPPAETDETGDGEDITATAPGVAAPHQAEPDDAVIETYSAEPLQDFYDRFISQRLELGTRRTSHRYRVTEKGDRQTRVGTYFGTINQIIVDDDSSWNKFYVQYALHDMFGVGYARDDHRLITRDGPSPAETDGDATIDSSYTYVFLRYRFDFGLAPFLEYGRGRHRTGFDPDPAWASRGNNVTLEDTSSSYYAYGIEYYFTDHLAVHMMRRRTDYTIRGEYTVRDGRPPLPIEIGANQTVTGIGVKLIF